MAAMDKLAAIADNRRFLSVPTRELPALAASFLEGAAESGTVLIEEGRPNDVLYLWWREWSRSAVAAATWPSFTLAITSARTRRVRRARPGRGPLG